MALKPLNAGLSAPKTEENPIGLQAPQTSLATQKQEKALATATPEEVQKVYDLAVDGDLGRLSQQEKVIYLRTVAERLGLNPLTRPFGLIKLDGKVVLYALKECAAQISKRDAISVHVSEVRIIAELGIAEVSVRASTPDGRFTDEIAAIAWGGKLIGENAANARMKLVTKGKRRAILSHSGLGVIDESELDTVRNVERIDVYEEKRNEQIAEKPKKATTETALPDVRREDPPVGNGEVQEATVVSNEESNRDSVCPVDSNDGPFNYDSTEDRQWLITNVKKMFPRIMRSDVINLCGTFAREKDKATVLLALGARLKHEESQKKLGKPSLIP